MGPFGRRLDTEREPPAPRQREPHTPRGPCLRGWHPRAESRLAPPPLTRPSHTATPFWNGQSERARGLLLLEGPRVVLTHVPSSKTHPARAPILQAK